MKLGRKTKWFGLLALVVVASLVGGYFWLTYDTSPVNSENYELISRGMTQTEVTQLLGKPLSMTQLLEIARKNEDNWSIVRYDDFRVTPRIDYPVIYAGNRYVISTYFDENGKL